jgi:hypothetical protein
VAIATFALVTPLGFFVKGSNASAQPGTTMLANADVDLTINTVPAGGAPISLAAAPAPVTSAGAMTVRSTVLLRNGDRISGQVSGLTDGVYTIVTANGNLRVAAADVREITALAANTAANVRERR